MFSLSTEALNQEGAYHTTTEIYQQPEVWEELIHSLSNQAETLQSFIGSIYENHHHVRVIFTGAGSSSFIGDILVPELSKHNPGHVQFESIPTTDIVSNPSEYLQGNVPTIMVSFARSGNSPESVAAVELGEKIIEYFYQLVITCNDNGKLAQNVQNDPRSFVILMPDKSNDKSLAMTSSFTSMMLAAYTSFTSQKLDQSVLRHAETLRDYVDSYMNDILNFNFNRIVYLGSGMLAQLSQEAALKMLELTAGEVVSMHESSLGFRHGPKSFLNEQSLIVMFMSNDPYTRKYDMDMLRELAEDRSSAKIVAVTTANDANVTDLADWTITLADSNSPIADDIHSAFLDIIIGQSMALYKSIQLGMTPDNPSPSGQINRVVQGVTIYDYTDEN